MRRVNVALFDIVAALRMLYYYVNQNVAKFEIGEVFVYDIGLYFGETYIFYIYNI